MRRSATRQRALAAGYRSGLEEEMAENLKERGITFTYEEEKIKKEHEDITKLNIFLINCVNAGRSLASTKK